MGAAYDPHPRPLYVRVNNVTPSPQPMPPMRLIRAGGALVWRFRDPARPIIPGEVLDERDIEVLLVHRPQYHDWSWPKGKIEGKETIPVAAVREVEEETGHVIRLGAPLTTQRYRLGSGQTKEVRYWVGTLMDSDGGKDEGLVHLRKPVHRAPSREIDQTQWMTTSRAHDLLTRRGDRRLLTELVMRGRSGELVTTALALLPHARTVSAQQWEGDEEARPLSRVGVREALELVDLLSSYGVRRAMATSSARTRQTLGPWAALAGVDIEALPSRAAGANSPSSDEAFARALISDSQPRVLCTPRSMLPGIFDVFRQFTPSGVRMNFPLDARELSASEMVILHTVVHGGQVRVLDVERHAPRAGE